VAVRALGDRFQARWQSEEPGVVTTTMEVPALDDLPIKLDAVRQIHHVARLVIDAFQYRHICLYGPRLLRRRLTAGADIEAPLTPEPARGRQVASEGW
jgi:hypothetical protein